MQSLALGLLSLMPPTHERSAKGRKNETQMIDGKLKRILIVDDDRHVRESLAAILEHAGYACSQARDGKDALHRSLSEPFDLMLLDLKLPRIGGLEVLKSIMESHRSMQVIMISGHGTIAKAVEATKIGAYDFLEKPLEKERVLITVRNALEKSRLKVERDRLLGESRARYQMIGSHRSMQKVFQMIDSAAAVDSKVLLTGESGTGKERVARAIHANSRRAAGSFIPVNCAAIPENLIESELFGHTKGAFTGAIEARVGKFELASGGTLFLDEIADMSLMIQAKLLRVIESREVDPVGSKMPVPVDVRIIAATNKNLKSEVEEGNFREDLYYRINVIPISLPPLRERKTDIPLLCTFFLEEVCRDQGLPAKVVSQQAWPVLKNHAWPGNVRELRNVIERLAVLHAGKLIDAASVAVAMHHDEPPDEEKRYSSLRQARVAFEKDFIIQALAENGGKIQESAKALGIQRSHLWKKMKQYGIEK